MAQKASKGKVLQSVRGQGVCVSPWSEGLDDEVFRWKEGRFLEDDPRVRCRHGETNLFER